MDKLFTHTDLDGIGCAILAKIAFKHEIEVEFCDYDNINEKVNTYLDEHGTEQNCILITDISVDDETAQRIDNRENKLNILFDHHPTALHLNKYRWCFVEVEDKETQIKTSGTYLFYEWLLKYKLIPDTHAIRTFATMVRDYDTWRWATLGEYGAMCKKINDLLGIYGRDAFIDLCIRRINKNMFPGLDSKDELVLTIKQKEIDNYIEEKDNQIFISEMCGYTCGFVFAEKHLSELGNRLCKMYPEIDFVAIINMGNNTVSYRTIKDIDLGKDIAKLFGGGGHPKAAGSQFTRETSLEIIKHIFKCKKVLKNY